MSKEEIISNSGMDDAESWWWFDDKVNLAMDEHAKEVAIEFGKWIRQNYYEFGDTMRMYKKKDSGNPNSKTESFTTEELYVMFLSSKK